MSSLLYLVSFYFLLLFCNLIIYYVSYPVFLRYITLCAYILGYHLSNSMLYCTLTLARIISSAYSYFLCHYT